MHWSLHGKPACLSGRDYSLRALPPNQTSIADDVTCKRCLTIMEKARERLTPRKVRR